MGYSNCYNSFQMKPSVKTFFRKVGCVLLLAVFFPAVTGDSLTHAVAPHDDCAICAMVAHGMVPGDPGPVLSCALIAISSVVVDVSASVLSVEHPVYLSRGPPTV